MGIAQYRGVLATNKWIGGGLPNATAWDQANNWGLGSAPSSTDDVAIDSAHDQPTIAFNSNVSINSLTLNGGAMITFPGIALPGDVVLNVLGSIVNNGSLKAPFGKTLVAATGGITNNGTGLITSFILDGNFITNGGTIDACQITLAGGITNNATGVITNSQVLTNSGDLTNIGLIADCNYSFQVYSDITNNVTGTITNSNLPTNYGDITNSGSITGGSLQASSGGITNSSTGTITNTRLFANSGNITNSGSITQAGEVYAASGNITNSIPARLRAVTLLLPAT